MRHLLLVAATLAATLGCTIASHQIGLQTPALPMMPGDPVEFGGALGGFWHPPIEVRRDDSVSHYDAWELHGTAFMRFALTPGTSMRITTGNGSSGTTLSASLFHPFTPQGTGRVRGGMHWGLGHRIAGLSLAYLDQAPVHPWAFHGVHGGPYMTAALTPAVSWHLNGVLNVPIVSTWLGPPEPGAPETLMADQAFKAEHSVTTGPIFWIHGARGRHSTFLMAELGVVVSSEVAEGAPNPAFAFQLSLGRTPRPRNVPRPTAPSR